MLRFTQANQKFDIAKKGKTTRNNETIKHSERLENYCKEAVDHPRPQKCEPNEIVRPKTTRFKTQKRMEVNEDRGKIPLVSKVAQWTN